MGEERPCKRTVYVGFFRNQGTFDESCVFVLWVFPVAKRGKTAGKLSFLRFQQIGRMYLFGNVFAVHFIQDIFEWGDVFMWDFSVIKELLMNPVYTGAIASQKAHYKFKIGTIGDKKPEE